MRRTKDLICSIFARDQGVGFFSHLWFLFLLWGNLLLKNLMLIPDGHCMFADETIPKDSLSLLDRSQKPIGIAVVLRKNTWSNRILVLMTARIAWEVFGVPVRFLGLSAARSDRMDGDRMLDRIGTEQYLKHYSRVIVITDLDMFTDGHRWVYGYAGAAIQGCAISTFRLGLDRENPWQVERSAWQRAVRVIMHELGHTYGLRHCPYDSCVMHDVPDSGLNGLQPKFCSSCREIIRSVRRGKRQLGN